MVQLSQFSHVIQGLLLSRFLSVHHIIRWGLRKHRKKGKIWVKIRRYVKVINIRNPHIDTEYFRNGRKNREYECGYRYKGFVM